VDATSQQPSAQIFKALGDPVRWSIMRQIAAAGELACVTLEDTVPLSKPTISYHAKILHQAGLINVRKSGRNYYYSVRRDMLHKLVDDLRELASAPRPVLGPVRKRRAAPRGSAVEAAILTW
jgi:DNA-binding transcriptional ArsR family regulator